LGASDRVRIVWRINGEMMFVADGAPATASIAGDEALLDLLVCCAFA
jgi:hypothetical protein